MLGMRKHSSQQNKTPTARKSDTRPQVVSPKDNIHGFFAALFALIAPHRFEKLAEYRNSNRGRPPELSLPDLLASLLFHFLCGAGTASEHMFQLLGRRIGDGSISDRRAVDAPRKRRWQQHGWHTWDPFAQVPPVGGSHPWPGPPSVSGPGPRPNGLGNRDESKLSAAERKCIKTAGLKLYLLPLLFLPDLLCKSLLPSFFVVLLPFDSLALILFCAVLVMTQDESEAEAT